MSRRGTVPATRGPYIDYRLAAENLGAITQTTLPMQESSKYAQPRDNMNFLERYHNRAMEMHTDIFTAEMMNERANLTLSMCAPLMFMSEHHMTFSSREYFMLPFDVGAVGAVPRRTFFHKSERTVSMQHYVRYQSMELNYLLDLKFGQQMLEETLGVIVAQARLTLYFQFAWGIVVCALEQSFDTFRNSKSSALYMHNQTSFFAIANADTQDFNLKLVQIRDPQRKYDTLLIPEYAGPHLNELARERRSVNGFHYDYDASTERLLLATFKAGDSVPSIPMSDGGYMDIVVNVALRYSNTGPERMRPTQTLEGYATLCEVVLQPPISPDEEPNAGPTDVNDPVSYDQTESHIQHNSFDVADAHSACGFWNNYTGELAKKTGGDGDNPMGFGNIYTDVIGDMNKDSATQSANVKWLDSTTFGNDTPSSDDWEKGNLESMTFRKFPWATVQEEDDGTKIVTPAYYILSLPEMAFPTAHVKRTVRGLHNAWKKDYKDLEVGQFMHMVLPDHDEDPRYDPERSRKAPARPATPAPIIVATGSGVPAKIIRYRDLKSSLIRDINKDVGSLRRKLFRLGAAELKTAFRPHIEALVGSLDLQSMLGDVEPKDKAELKKDMDSVGVYVRETQRSLAALDDAYKAMKKDDLTTDEAKAEYDTINIFLVKPEMLQDAYDDFVRNVEKYDGSSPSFFDMRVPKSHMAHFEAAYHRMEQEKKKSQQDKELFAAVSRGSDAVLAALRETSGKEGSRNVIEDFAAHLERGGSVADFGNGNVSLLTMRAKSKDRLIPDNEMSQTQSSNVEDAMDIDGPPAFAARGQATFGAYGPREIPADSRERAYPILVKRLDASPFKGHADLDAIYYLLGRSYFSHKNVYSLQKNFGLQIYRLNFWRPWQRYRMYHMIAMVRGPQTMVTGFASPIVHPAFQGMEGYINIVAQFFSALIVAEPKNVKFIPNVMAAGLLTDINTQFVRSNEECMSQNVHKPSTIAEPVPLDETKYQWPLHIMNKDSSHYDDPQAASPYLLHSGSPLMQKLLGVNYLQRSWAASIEADPMTQMDISLVGHRSWAMYLDKRLGRYNLIPGTSPRGQNYHNACQAAAVWAGAAVRFPITGQTYTRPITG